jgi:uncharacterized protein YbjT (DUF2867 family)
MASSDQREVVFDYLDPSISTDAQRGADSVFLLNLSALSNTKATIKVFLDAARRIGVAQVVFALVAGAGSIPFLSCHAVKQHLLAAPPGWTIAGRRY